MQIANRFNFHLQGIFFIYFTQVIVGNIIVLIKLNIFTWQLQVGPLVLSEIFICVLSKDKLKVFVEIVIYEQHIL